MLPVRHGAWHRAVRSPLVALFAVLALVLAGALAPVVAPAKAADLSQFDPGYIISDAVFYNSGTMSQADIQNFLQSQESGCQSGSTCLKDYYDTTRTIAGDAMCGTYSGGGQEQASAIIYKVAQACGVNPQVILVMLQKEQGLVTSTSPSSWGYSFAMGANCPDTTGCNGNSSGFFIQVYSGVWQLKRYSNPPGTSQYFTWFAPGNTWNIQYNPDANCGTKAVYIRNQATANLYYYTPYTPDAAALAAGYGTGDYCSSYGNRNFYNYFTDWFGSTGRDPFGDIDAEYQAVGGVAVLGAPTSGYLTLTRNGGGYARAYTNGSIYWSAAYGAKTVMAGPVRDYYFGLNGSDGNLAWPASEQQQISGGSVTGVGQMFGGGSVYSSSLGTFSVREPIRTTYFSFGGAAGSLGWPVADQACTGTVCAQSYQGGQVVSSASGVFAVAGAYGAAYSAAGGSGGSWGAPTSGLVTMSGGTGQAFQNGSAYAVSGGSVAYVTGRIRDFYFSTGGATGSLGYPLAAAQCSSVDSCQQAFQNGWVITSPGAVRVGVPAIDAAYAAAGGSAGPLGAATGSFVQYSYGAGGFAQAYANGAIYLANGAATALPVSGPTRDAYFRTGGAAGALGWPTSASACTGSVCRQDFQGGSIVTGPTGTFSITDPVRAAYDAAGGLGGVLGAPTSALIPMSYQAGTGGGQAFVGGSVYFQTGGSAYVVSGGIRGGYFAVGGASGRLGYPTGAMQCSDASTCQQAFQFGWIVWTAASGARLTVPAIDTVYAQSGGASGPLGAQSGDFVYYGNNGGGFASVYARGSIYYKPAVGAAYAVSAGIRDAYWAAGGAAGAYGWPTGAVVCTGGTCTQSFEGGTLSARQ